MYNFIMIHRIIFKSLQENQVFNNIRSQHTFIQLQNDTVIYSNCIIIITQTISQNSSDTTSLLFEAYDISILHIKYPNYHDFNSCLILSLSANIVNMSFSKGCNSPGIINECKGPPISTETMSFKVAASIVCVSDPTLASPIHIVSSVNAVKKL